MYHHKHFQSFDISAISISWKRMQCSINSASKCLPGRHQCTCLAPFHGFKKLGLGNSCFLGGKNWHLRQSRTKSLGVISSWWSNPFFISWQTALFDGGCFLEGVVALHCAVSKIDIKAWEGRERRWRIFFHLRFNDSLRKIGRKLYPFSILGLTCL